jgi:GT2 family glycosyltransferase
MVSRRVESADVTAVVLTRNRPDTLLRAVESLDRGEVPLTILVTDNDSEPP